MKERVMVKYSFQNDKYDKTSNCFFVLRDTEKSFLIIDLLSQFPCFATGEYSGQGFHFRFLDKFGKNMCWVDIKNLRAVVPMNKGLIEMRVLVMPDQTDSLIFGDIYREIALRNKKSENNTNSNSSKTPAATPQPKPVQKKTVQPEPQRASEANFLSDDDFEIDVGAIINNPAKQSTQSAPNYGSGDGGEVDILNQFSVQPEEVKPSQNDNEKLNEMFGADFNPMERNRVLDCIYIEQNKKEQVEKNIRQIDDRNKKIIEIQDAKLEASILLEPKIKQWAFNTSGQRNNVRVLLTTLNQALWENCEWENISMSDLVSDSSVKKNFVKAVTKFHPDRNQDVTDPKQMYLMDRIFNILNDSYQEFTKQKTK